MDVFRHTLGVSETKTRSDRSFVVEDFHVVVARTLQSGSFRRKVPSPTS